ncbi:MAG TPA: hypothetical protein V6D23_00445 [Candidatus Obscuribacterales bacterium]
MKTAIFHSLLTTLLLSGTALTPLAQAHTNVVEDAPVTPAQVIAAHGLTPGWVEKLKSVGFPVLVPTFVPKGFSVESVDAERDSLRAPAHYLIKYIGPHEQNFWITAGKHGQGTPPPGIRTWVRHPAFGTIPLWRYGHNDQQHSSLFTGCAIKLGQVCYDFQSVSGEGQLRVSNWDATKILMSLTRL